MIDTLQEIWGAIMRNKMRTAATGIAVASGIFLLIVLLGASNGIIHTLEQNSEGLSLDAIHIYPGFTSKPFNGIKEGRRIELDDRDISMPKKRFKENVTEVTATVEQSGLTASVGKQHLSVTLTGEAASECDTHWSLSSAEGNRRFQIGSWQIHQRLGFAAKKKGGCD